MPGQCICRIYASMLSASASKIDHQVTEIAFYIICNRYIYYIKYTVEVIRHFGLLFQKIFYWFITPGKFLVFIKATGIKNTPAIKYKTTTVCSFIGRNPFAVRETIDLNHKGCICISPQWLKPVNYFIAYTKTEAFFKYRNSNTHALV